MSAPSIDGLAEIQDRLGGLAARLRVDLAPVLAAEAQVLADRAGGLAGGRLGASIEVAATGVGVAVGSDLPYARLRELGFQGSETVKAYLRQVRQAFGRPVAPHPVAVRAFTRSVDVPARPYLGPALDAAADDLADSVAAVVEEAISA